MDSGCSSHMTGNRKIFVELDQDFTSKVRLGDGKIHRCEGKGTIIVHTKGGNKKFISDVLYVPNLTSNLLSVGQLTQRGYSVVFEDGECNIFDKKTSSSIITVPMSSNRVFPLIMPLEEKVALAGESVDQSQIWHLRYRHLNWNGLQLLKKNNMVIGLLEIESKTQKKPVVDHLKIFGSIAYSHISTPNRDKFDEKSEKLIFVGYSDESKGYRLYHPIIQKLVVARDAIFDETTLWNWEGKSAEHLSQNDFYESSNVEDETEHGVPPPQSPNPTVQIPPDHIADSSSESPIRKTRSLREIYEMIADFKKRMMKEFEMTDLGIMKYFLGIQVKQSGGEIVISQEKYIEDLLKKFHMENCNPVFSPMATNDKLKKDDGSEKVDAQLFRSLVGSLIYLTNTRPDIVQAVGMLSRFLNESTKLHFAAAKRIMRYLQGTKRMGIKYVKEIDLKLIGYTDSDWGGSLDDRKSTSGYLFSLGTNIVSWSSKKQKTVALSSAEAEYIAASDATCEGIWLRRLLEDLQQVMNLDEESYTFMKSHCRSTIIDSHIQQKAHSDVNSEKKRSYSNNSRNPPPSRLLFCPDKFEFSFDQVVIYESSIILPICLFLFYRNASSVSSTHELLSYKGSPGEWHSDLLGCCSEPLLCSYSSSACGSRMCFAFAHCQIRMKTLFFPCGTLSRIASVAANRHISAAETCNDLLAYSLILSCCCYTCCIRRKLRKILNIKGGLADVLRLRRRPRMARS
ncbi:hypothetical protein SASPL_141342 [Salvia splendens]|uniref:Uncharacterized protein n=1 Tax=Salvia splendens TaxID=180675 RepID=A0A8X8ZCP7_SALSN|nr:hypothetical protein SASPL_141342 [Salvia splendens]